MLVLYSVQNVDVVYKIQLVREMLSFKSIKMNVTISDFVTNSSGESWDSSHEK